MDVFGELFEAQRGYLLASARAALWGAGVSTRLRDGGPATAAALAAALSLSPHRLEALLDALVCAGDLTYEGEGPTRRYRRATSEALTPLASTGQGWGALTSVLRDDAPVPLPMDPERIVRYHTHLTHVGATHAEALITSMDHLDGPLLDIGGGLGGFARTFAQARSGDLATVLDRAEVVACAEPHPALTFKDGDALTLRGVAEASFGIVLLSHVLHLFDALDCGRILDTAWRRVRPGGALVVKDLYRAPGGLSPEVAVWFSLNMAIYTEGGRVHEANVIQRLLEALPESTDIARWPVGEPHETLVIAARRPKGARKK